MAIEIVDFPIKNVYFFSYSYVNVYQRVSPFLPPSSGRWPTGPDPGSGRRAQVQYLHGSALRVADGSRRSPQLDGDPLWLCDGKIHLFLRTVNHLSHRIHGAGIYTNIKGIY